MNLITHILSVLLLGKILPISGFEWVLAFIFGVFIDIDHIFKLPIFLKFRNFRTIRYLNWRSSIQEPVSYLWVIPLSIFFKSYVPVLFFTLHLALDYMMSYEKKPFFPFSNYTIRDTKKFRRDGVLQAVVSLLIICTFLLI